MLRFRNLALLALAVAAGGVGMYAVKQVLQSDPLAAYRPRQGLFSDGVELANVKFKHYETGNLVAQCNIGRIQVNDDRQTLNFEQVTNGRFSGKQGNFEFGGKSARYDAITKRLDVIEGGRLKNKDINLAVPAFYYDARVGVLEAPGKFTGEFYGGTIVANGITYTPKRDHFRIGPASWEGKLPSSLQQAAPGSRSVWKIKNGGIVEIENGQQYWRDGAEATDGEIIVKASLITRDLKTDTIVATGKVQYFSAEANLVCEKATVFRKEKRAILTGNVQMLVKPSDQEKLEVIEIPPFRPMVPEQVAKDRPPAPPEDKTADDEVRSDKTRRKYPIAIRSAKIEYWYKKGGRRAVITGDPQARQDMANGRWRAIWTTTAYWDGEADILKLASPEGKKTTRVKTSIGDNLICNWFEISTREDVEKWRAFGVEGDVYPDEEDLPPPKKDEKKGGGGGLSGRIGA